MSEEVKQAHSACDIESHGRHLCYLISQGFHLSDEQEFKVLTEDPKFQCGHCGRQANSDVNLCVPTEL